MKRLAFCIICIGLIVFALLITAGQAEAQNFANFYGKESEESEAALNSAQTGSLLKEPLEKNDELTELLKTAPMEVGLRDPSNYTLGPTDVIEISVLRHPEFSGEFEINKEGKIQYDYVGDVKVAGLTKDELTNVLTDILSEYIISPDVTVKITAYNSKIVYVIGEVGAPGKIFMQGDVITIREALVQAGLPLLSASTKKCRLITPSEDGKPDIKYVNVFALLYEGDLRENVIMKPGDTLYIPATVMAKAMRVISPVTQPIGSTAGTARSVYPGY